MQTDTHKALCTLLQGDYKHETSKQLVRRVEGLVNSLRAERDDLTTDLRSLRDALTTRLLEVVDVTGVPSVSKLLEELIAEYRASERALKEIQGDYRHRLQEIKTLRDAQPTHDKRYIVHGDIQPCVVLYSDETTTLVRLDETDMMCETDTIEWSDELTYRCQEMLRGEAKRSGGHVSLPTIKLVAQLVRDERILLNDDSGSYQWKPAMDDRARCVKPDVKYVAPKTCMTCWRVSEGTLDLCPQCHTPFGGSDNA